MATKMVMCDPCSRLNKSSEGKKFCTNCEDALCTDCSALHSAVKLLASHHLVDVSVSALNAFNIKKDCDEHEGMCFEFYCFDHDCLICRTCMANNHRTCGKIQPIDVVAKGCRSSAMLESITKEITTLFKSTKELVVERQGNKTRAGKIKAKVFKEIAKLRQDINSHLDQLESTVSSEVESMDKMICEKACSDLCEADKRYSDVTDLWQKLDFFTKHGSESQLFIFLKTINTDIARHASNLQDLIQGLKTNDIGFEASDLPSVIKSFGSVKVESSLCTVIYQHPNHMQAPTREKRPKVPSKFEFKEKVTIPSGHIICMVVTDDNRILLCNDQIKKKNVSLWTETGKHLESCTVGGKACGIAILPAKNEAVVTLSDVKCIQFINITNFTPGRKIPVDVPTPYGVAAIRDNIYVGSEDGKVSIINLLSGKCIKTLNVGCSYITSIVPFVDNTNELLYYCEYGDNLVSCITLDGTLVFSCLVDGPLTLALDTQGNSYVAALHANELHRISPDGKVDDIILQDGLEGPSAVTFNKIYNKIYISNMSNVRNVMIFNCK